MDKNMFQFYHVKHMVSVYAMYEPPMYGSGINETGITAEIQRLQNYVDSVKSYNDARTDPAERLDGVQSDIEIFPRHWNPVNYTEAALNYTRIFASVDKKGLFFSAEGIFTFGQSSMALYRQASSQVLEREWHNPSPKSFIMKNDEMTKIWQKKNEDIRNRC